MENKIAVVSPGNVDSTGSRIEIGEIECSLLKQCLELWLAKRGGRAFPSRNMIRPRDMVPYLRNVTLCAITNDDFEYKIMGDAAVVAWGRSFMGMRREDLNRLQPGMGDVIWKVCQSVIRRRCPLVLRGQLWHGEYDVTRQETIFLPLGPNDELVTYILSVGSYRRAVPFSDGAPR